MTNIQNLLERQPLVKSLMVQIGEIASKQKKKAYAVGGAVRDVCDLICIAKKSVK